MPTYDYACTGCGSFEAYRSMSDRDRPATCPACGQEAPRLVGSAPHPTSMDPLARRLASQRAENIEAAGRYARMRHAAGCRCC